MTRDNSSNRNSDAINSNPSFSTYATTSNDSPKISDNGLPYGSTKYTINGHDYWLNDGVWYYYQDGKYTVVDESYIFENTGEKKRQTTRRNKRKDNNDVVKVESYYE